jgi:hypothetical protein
MQGIFVAQCSKCCKMSQKQRTSFRFSLHSLGLPRQKANNSDKMLENSSQNSVEGKRKSPRGSVGCYGACGGVSDHERRTFAFFCFGTKEGRRPQTSKSSSAQKNFDTSCVETLFQTKTSLYDEGFRGLLTAFSVTFDSPKVTQSARSCEKFRSPHRQKTKIEPTK